MNSELFSLNGKDLIKGLIIVVLTAIITGVITVLQTPNFVITWAVFKPVFVSGITAGLAYLLKNFITNSSGQIGKSE